MNLVPNESKAYLLINEFSVLLSQLWIRLNNVSSKIVWGSTLGFPSAPKMGVWEFRNHSTLSTENFLSSRKVCRPILRTGFFTESLLVENWKNMQLRYFLKILLKKIAVGLEFHIGYSQKLLIIHGKFPDWELKIYATKFFFHIGNRGGGPNSLIIPTSFKSFIT